jgi:hypothetical protein
MLTDEAVERAALRNVGQIGHDPDNIVHRCAGTIQACLEIPKGLPSLRVEVFSGLGASSLDKPDPSCSSRS